MAQNRGYRRDGRQNYQMNSSQGYGRAGPAVNPWEGGMVPGGRGGVAGLLPTPPQTSSLLSQLSSSPEAQLALASNLLSTILRPQQQSQVSSLLSLDTVGPMGGSGYRQGGYGRYDDPGPNRRKRMDARRPDPYNKGRRNAPARGGADWKTGGNQGLRSSSIGKGRSGTVSKTGGKAEKADKKDDETKKETEDKTNDGEKKSDEEETKREDGEGDEKKSEEEEDDDEKGEKSKDNTRYSGIPPALLYCHVCKKHMWDENSFVNHLKGRTHLLMMDKLEESYKIKVELMRHEQKVAEQQREIELERVKRQGKKVNMNIREYCTMCDLHFFGNLIVHRKNDRHQQLKNFLHPRCPPCGKEFPTRVEWDHHRLTPLHLRKTADARSKSRKSGDDEFGIEELIKGEEDFFAREIKVRTREEEEEEIKEAEKQKEEGDESKEKDENAEGNEGEEKEGDKNEESITSGNLRFSVPKYNPDVAVGLSLLKKLAGHMCRACHRFFVNSEDAKLHCRTMIHYNNFVALVKKKAKAAEAKEKREAKSEEQNNEENSEEKSDKGTKRTEDMSTVDDEGNWKRRKVANKEEDEDADVPDEKYEQNNKTEKESDKDGDKEEAVETNDGDGDEAEAEAEEEKEEKESTKKQDEEEEEEEEEKEKKDDKSKSKKDDESGDDSIWSEVDRDIGNLLDAVDGEGETESLNDEELLNPKQDDSPGKGTPRGRNKAVRGGGSTPAKATRGRKKK